MTKMIFKFVANESGATAIEYGLISALIGIVLIGASKVLGTAISTQYLGIATTLSAVPTTVPVTP